MQLPSTFVVPSHQKFSVGAASTCSQRHGENRHSSIQRDGSSIDRSQHHQYPASSNNDSGSTYHGSSSSSTRSTAARSTATSSISSYHPDE